MEKIENTYLAIIAEALGGEIHSIKSKKTGIEYLWNGDSAHWPGHAPVLFPFVGQMSGKVGYTHGGQEIDFPYLQHGFARKTLFTVKEQTENSITYSLASNQELFKIYPFEFTLEIKHTLQDNTIATKYTVYNAGKEILYFKIGAHPGYMCPMKPEANFEDYYLEFEEAENLDTMRIVDGLMTTDTEKILGRQSRIPLNYPLFDKDALVFANTKSQQVALKSDKHDEYIKFNYEGFPVIAFWTKKDAPFICLEPWFGHTDFADTPLELSQKPGIVKLDAEKTFTCEYSVGIYE